MTDSKKDEREEAVRTIYQFITPVLMDVANGIDSPALPNMARSALNRLPALESALALRQPEVTEATDEQVAALKKSLWSGWGKGRMTTDWPSDADLRAALNAAIAVGLNRPR